MKFGRWVYHHTHNEKDIVQDKKIDSHYSCHEHTERALVVCAEWSCECEAFNIHGALMELLIWKWQGNLFYRVLQDGHTLKLYFSLYLYSQWISYFTSLYIPLTHPNILEPLIILLEISVLSISCIFVWVLKTLGMMDPGW